MGREKEEAGDAGRTRVAGGDKEGCAGRQRCRFQNGQVAAAASSDFMCGVRDAD